MTEAPKILLAHQLKTLKLPTFLRKYEKQARQCAAEGLGRFLVARGIPKNPSWSTFAPPIGRILLRR